MDFSYDSTSRLSATDELMMGSPHASPAKPPKVSGRDDRRDSSYSFRVTIGTARHYKYWGFSFRVTKKSLTLCTVDFTLIQLVFTNNHMWTQCSLFYAVSNDSHHASLQLNLLKPRHEAGAFNLNRKTWRRLTCQSHFPCRVVRWKRGIVGDQRFEFTGTFTPDMTLPIMLLKYSFHHFGESIAIGSGKNAF